MIATFPRIQCWAIRSWIYDFTIEYTAGKINLIADALSKASPQDTGF